MIFGAAGDDARSPGNDARSPGSQPVLADWAGNGISKIEGLVGAASTFWSPNEDHEFRRENLFDNSPEGRQLIPPPLFPAMNADAVLYDRIETTSVLVVRAKCSPPLVLARYFRTENDSSQRPRALMSIGDALRLENVYDWVGLVPE
eukprot:CAMPEP_0197252564 /NCGR_PEP_ID=MMETSP1429-20130617/61965_1 /TAXON_ID=49237 /ORGANISM="Chaetoceros  sp., Strain UNC1202" /LENGTH=146 /DNA_ID=CAMNT_0042714983 /DNA_START=112 /DNA_END=552 /DNA_ORIENTATION=+